jgi:hypothetical protein
MRARHCLRPDGTEYPGSPFIGQMHYQLSYAALGDPLDGVTIVTAGSAELCE